MRGAMGLVALIVVGQLGCDECPECSGTALDIEQWCGENRLCLLDGEVALPISVLELPDQRPIYYMSFLGQGVTLTVPLGAIWPLVGTSDDLELYSDSNGATADFRVATLLFDGQPPPGGMCTRRVDFIWCNGIPHTVQTMDLRFEDGHASVSLYLSDAECEECPL